MIASFVASWYGWLVIVLGVYVFWASVIDTGHRHARWIRGRILPPASLPPEPPRPPVVIVTGPSCSYSKVPLNERRLVQEHLLTRLSVLFEVQNKEGLVTITRLEAGARRDDGREQRFDFKQAALEPLGKATVRAEITRDMFEGLVESDFQAAFTWWVHFTGPDGIRWEIGYDGAAQDLLEPRALTPGGSTPV